MSNVGSTRVRKVYPSNLGELLRSGDKKSVDIFLDPDGIRELIELLSRVKADHPAALVLEEVPLAGDHTQQLWVQEYDRIPVSRKKPE